MLNNPSNTITLPEEVAAEVEKVRQNLSVQEIELKNIRKARASEEASIAGIIKQNGELVAEKATLEDKISALTIKLKEVEERVASGAQEAHKLSLISADLEIKITKQREEDALGFQLLDVEKDKLRIETEKLADRERVCVAKEIRINSLVDGISKLMSTYGN